MCGRRRCIVAVVSVNASRVLVGEMLVGVGIKRLGLNGPTRRCRVRTVMTVVLDWRPV